MLPVIALVGRPNVGKSTLFNALTRTRDALVADFPGLTRDRQYGFGRLGECPYIVVDTGGLSGEQDGLDGLMAKQTLAALDEADTVLFMVDAREGLTSPDHQAAQLLRRSGKTIFVVVNKAEGQQSDLVEADFQQFGFAHVVSISAVHRQGLRSMMDEVLAPFIDAPEPDVELVASDDATATDGAKLSVSGLSGEAHGVLVAVLGRPNAGKSTLINRMIGEQRVVAFDQPGTTRDAVLVPFERDGKPYTLIDTAGVRRRSRVDDVIEKFSVIKTLQAVERANVVVAMIDAHEGVTDQDASLLGLALERGRATVVAINKWDGLTSSQRDDIKRQIDVKLPFLDFAQRHFISALHGTAVGDLFPSIDAAFAAAVRELPTPELTRALEDAMSAHPPPLVRGRRPRLRYAHQGGRNPPLVVIHGTQAKQISDSYRRYLTNYFREQFRLHGTPVRITLKSTENPYAGRRNKLTPRQQVKRKRMMKHHKKK